MIIDKIRAAGVVGAGGAGLPTHIKADAKVETVLVNGASCEPLLMSDPYLLEVEINNVISGLKAVMDCTKASKGIICLKGKHANALESIRTALNHEKIHDISYFVLDDFYPAGDEQVMLYAALGKVVPERGLPLQIGAVVCNVETLLNIAYALDDKPVTHRYLTVEGEINKPMVVRVPVGTCVAEVLEFAGGVKISDYKVVDGGPMMGRVLPDIYQPVTKTTSGLLVLPSNHNVVAQKTMPVERIRQITNTICCQCTRCTDLCPRKLLGHSLNPHKIMRVLHSQELDNEAAKEALLCSECGICEKFACPMGISPREVNAQIKQILMKNNVRWEVKQSEFIASAFNKERRIPTKRLLQRLAITQYDTHPSFAGTFETKTVYLPLKQHIGAPSQCIVNVGDSVSCGDVIGEIPENAMAARVHASISGVVESIQDGIVCITNK